MKEVYKDITGFEGLYQVSNYGRVKSLNRRVNSKSNSKRGVKKRILKTRIGNNGYEMIILSKKQKGYGFCVHTLVWDAFGDKSRNGRKLQIDHIDGNKSNNHIDNLQVLTPRENTNKFHLGRRNLPVGVFYRADCSHNKYMAHISHKGQKTCLGFFATASLASQAYQKAVEEL